MNCWLKFKFHKWGTPTFRGMHMWKDCDNCNATRMSSHVSCPKECWGGPV